MLWTMTTFLNPMRYQRRLKNYETFRQHLKTPLLTVELSFDGEYQLEESDADIMIRVPVGGLMWQKERLLNIGIDHLPAECESVACIDADIVFANSEWPRLAEEALSNTPIVQLNEQCLFLSENARYPDKIEIERQRISLGKWWSEQSKSDMDLNEMLWQMDGKLTWGHAIGFQKEFLENAGFFDSCIIGGGDTALLCANLGATDYCITKMQMRSPQTELYLRWAESVQALTQRQFGYLPGTSYHLWHGSYEDRSSTNRHDILRDAEFDASHDIALNEHGAWVWNSEKPALHNQVAKYFANRREDHTPQVGSSVNSHS